MNSSHFTDVRLVSLPHMNPFLGKLLEHYDLTPDLATAEAGMVQTRVALPYGSALLWDRATSLPRGPLRRHLLRAVSVTLQDALRCWVPYLWLSHPTHWEEPYLLWPMLIYATSRTFKPISRENYTFDLMCPATVPSLLRSSLPNLRAWLPALQQMTDDRPAVRREMRIGRVLNVVEHSDFDPHPLKRLLAHEHKLITAFVDFADGDEPGGFDRFGPILHRHLNRIYTRVDFSFLAPLLHIEAENSLAVDLLGRPILNATLDLSPAPPEAKPARLPRPAFTFPRLVRQPNRRSPVHSA